MSSALFHLFNHVTVTQTLHDESLQVLNTLLRRYAELWKHAESRREEIEAEGASLYQYKTVGGGLTEDQMDALEIQKLFPEFNAVSL